MILIVTYDLRTPKDYHDFFEAIKAQGEQGKWWHYMSSTWLLSTSKTPQAVFDAIHPHLDKQDFVFVCEMASNYQGWLPKPAWDWIAAEFPAVNSTIGAYLAGLAALNNPGTAVPGLDTPPAPIPMPGFNSFADLLTSPPKKPGER